MGVGVNPLKFTIADDIIPIGTIQSGIPALGRGMRGNRGNRPTGRRGIPISKTPPSNTVNVDNRVMSCPVPSQKSSRDQEGGLRHESKVALIFLRLNFACHYNLWVELR